MANQIEQLQHNFLWDEPKFHLADRAKLCAPLPSGGLAIRSLRHSNEVLLGKWLWRFGFERDALWRRLIEVKNGCEIWGEGGWGGWCSNSVSGSLRVSFLKYIRQGFLKFLELYSAYLGVSFFIS